MILKTSSLILLINLAAIHGFFDLRQPGDVIIGQLLPVHQSSDKLRCAKLDLGNVIKVEALVYATKRLNNETSGLKIGYDVIDTCSETTPSPRLNFAEKKWLQDEKNISRIPIAIITDLSDEFQVSEFHKLGAKLLDNGKDHIPLISLKYRKKVWENAFSMSPAEDASQRAIFGLVRHFKLNIVDLVNADGSDGVVNFRDLSKESDVCLLNEVYFSHQSLEWLKKGRKYAPVTVLFSKEDEISNFIEALPENNLTSWNIMLGHQVPYAIQRWASSMVGVVGIRMNYGNLDDFEKYLRASSVFENAATKALCSNVTASECSAYKDGFIKRNIHKGASVIDAVYGVMNSHRTYDSNRLIKVDLSSVHTKSATGRVVSFHQDDSTINEVTYDVLNFREKKFDKVGKIEFAPTAKVTISVEIVWKNEIKQPRCSADCAPGTWRKTWDRVRKCCWDCVPCDIGTVSSYMNSTRCVKCPAGTKPTSDQTKCQPPYIDYLRWHDPFSLIMFFLLAFTICFLVYAVDVFVKKANTPVFLRSKSASLSLLLSLFVTFILPVLLLMKPTQSSCGAYNAIFLFSLGIPLTFLIVRSHVVLNYCYGNDGEMKRKWFRCSPQTVISFFLITLQLIIVVIVLAAAPAKVLTLASLEPDVDYIECASHSRPEFLPLVFFILVLIMAFNILHMSEESSPANQNEVKFVSLGIFLMYTIIFVYFVAVFGINGKKKIRVLCAMGYLFGLNFFATIFLPKIYVIIFRPEENLPDISRLLKDENGNQNVSRLSNRECVESPLLGLQAGPYDRTEV